MQLTLRWIIVTLFLSVVTASVTPVSYAQDKGKAKDDEKAKTDEKDEFEYSLENIFDEKGMFGPSARSISFSADGRYAAYLYHPYIERRHGNDLYVYDFKTGESKRMTSVSRLAEFQESTRKVQKDREDKLKKAKSGKKDDNEDESDAKESDETKKDDDKSADKKKNTSKSKKSSDKDDEQTDKTKGDEVTEKDADDEKAPRYGGVSSYTWHPKDNRLLFMSQGDIYEMDIAKESIIRLSKTDAAESQVDYLPDGSGFIYGANDVVYRAKFGEHFVEQLNPSLPSGQNLSGFELSPDGKRMVIIARQGERNPSGGRTVDIIRYRDRFAQSSSVPRTVSDDEVKPVDTYVYLYDLENSKTEEAKLIEVFHDKVDEPRDTISNPKWSLASDRITFCFFDQGESEVQILMAEFPEDMSKLKEEKSDKEENGDENAEDDEDGGGRFSRFRRSARSSAAPVVKSPARVVYRFHHFGGPNTPGMVDPQFAWDSNHILFVSELSGFRHLHLLDAVYESVVQLTQGNFEVYPFQIADDHKTIYVRATKDHPSREMVYRVNVEDGAMTQIGNKVGNYSSAAVSDDGSHMLSNFITYGELSELYAFDGDKDAVAITDSHPEKAKRFTEAAPEFFDYENRHGHKIHGMMFKPEGWKKNKKYPLLIYVYGGPLGTRHMVSDGSFQSDGYFFNSYMTKHYNYVTVVIDPRGLSGYGSVFEKANYEQVGKPQVEDLVDGVKFLTENAGADPERVGIYGWSFGGFQTQMCLYTEPDVFQVGIAGAGPTEWENYNSWYTTGTVGPSRKGSPDQKKYSLRPLAKDLKGKLLLIHGMEDTNVLFQDTVAIYRELLKAGKETNVELFLDPTGQHGLGGDVKSLNRYRKYEEFLLRTLGEQK
ncbi:MAG: prolyl oligopeptidase family serine peptidase [Pirellulaceae bacterium]